MTLIPKDLRANEPFPGGPTLTDIVAPIVWPNPLTELQQQRIEMIREAHEAFLEVILLIAPICADQSAAIRASREAAMWANAAIAKGLVSVPQLRSRSS